VDYVNVALDSVHWRMYVKTMKYLCFRNVKISLMNLMTIDM